MKTVIRSKNTRSIEPRIIKSFVTQSNNPKVVNALITGEVDNNREDIRKEVKRLLIESQLSIKEVLGVYKGILKKAGKVKYRGSDVVKVLENVTKLHNIEENGDEENKFRALLQSKTEDEVRTLLIETTNKTMEYLSRLEEVKKKKNSTP